MTEQEIRKRAEELTAKLTLEEKTSMIHGAQLFSTKGVERLGIPPLVMSDGPMGVRQEFEPDQWKAIGSGDDSVTYLPCNSALAATWNRERAEEIGSVLGAEARGRGKDVILAPGINIKRSPLCGRNFEYFSEDPYLTGELAAKLIHGIQRWDVAACVKHFAANNQETDRLWVEAGMDERTLREIYLPAFRKCLTKGGSLAVMGAYNKLYGEHCCQSDFLLNEILRKEWGFDGVVISDWGAVHDTEKAALSQLDIEMSVTNNFDEYYMADPLKRAVEAGEIPEACLDVKVTRILMLMMHLHMLDGQERKSGVYNAPEHRQSALRAARESVVLLKNENNRLPLAGAKMKRILLTGENACRIHSNGGGSAEIKAFYEISPLLGIRMLLGDSVKVNFVKGYDSNTQEENEEVNWQERSLENGGGRVRETAAGSMQELLRKEAVQAASSGEYDAVIYVGGLNHDYDCEGMDRDDMKLPYEQDKLIQELLAVRPDTVVVLIGGSPVEMGEWSDKADALVWSYYNGMEGGYALAETLFGKVNPSGKLPETFYKTHTNCSAHCVGEFARERRVNYSEGIFVGYRYNETFGIEPRFCFGHGLSYTEFLYEDAGYEKEENGCRIICRIRNTGKVEGAEIVQVYAMMEQESRTSELFANQKRAVSESGPVMELAGFEKIVLAPGEGDIVRIVVPERKEGRRWGIGSSVKDIRIVL